MGKLINRVVALITLASVMISIDIYVAVAITLSSIIITVLWFYGNKMGLAQSLESKPINKALSYGRRIFHLPDYAKELRVSNADELIKKQHEKYYRQAENLAIKYGKKYVLLHGLGTNILAWLPYFGILIYTTLRFSLGKLMLGSFAASVTLCWRFRWMLHDLSERIAKFPEHSLYIEKYREFMEAEPKIKTGSVKPGRFDSLKIDHVSFAYESVKPDKDGNFKQTKVLNDLSIDIKRGDKIAFVGYNGAGKTTLIKLIMRLYDVSEGAIYYNGHDLRELDIEDYRAHIGVVFQDFKLFAASIAENVAGGGYNESMKPDILKALDAATFKDKLETLSDGIDTHLTREYNENGTNLSGGEAQKVAIARVFAKPYDLIIMDEPSAALDPIAEASLNNAILEHAREHTIIFISHRLSTTKIADKIFMIDDGRIVESGSHEQLMAMNGKYAEMFVKQAEKYAAV